MKTVYDKNKTLLSLIIHAIIFVCTAITAVTGVIYGASSSQDGDNMIGLGYFKAFTMDSNILAGICALVVVIFAVKSLQKNENTMPEWAVILEFVAASCLLVTFVTVVFFLAPSDVLEGKSYFGMFSDDLFIFHLINPVLAILSFIFLQNTYRINKKECAWVLFPLVLYSVWYFMMVVVFKRWNDFYGFTFDGTYWLIPIVIIVMLLLAYYLGRLLAWMNGRAMDRK